MDEQDVDLFVPVDADGCFTKEITDFCGRYVKDADKDIINAVKARVTSGSLYFFCLDYWIYNIVSFI